MQPQTQNITLGDKKAAGTVIELPGAPLVVAQADKGFVMCGYLDIKTADKLNTAAAVVRGVKTVDDLLNAKVTDVSAAAAKLGAAPGMTGRDVLARFF
jgi:uncharacterized protein YunC (DUF1805 family)